MPEPNAPSGGAENVAGEPPDIPGHKLLRRIGRGSYGEVWLAQSAQGEYRAVKIVHRRTFERERPFEREFSGIQKFEPASRAHPSQVGILQVGRNDAAGFFYYVMELADDCGGTSYTSPKYSPKYTSPTSAQAGSQDGGGDSGDSYNSSLQGTPPRGREIDPENYRPRTLRSEVAAAGRIGFDRALDISLALTKALEHLHQHGLIHRDIKPSNIIFVGGVPKLADIGLVTDVGASISYVGTEGYLPPEGPVSQQADLYSLGKVLYEMSTGQDRLEFPELPTFLGDAGERNGLLELNLVFLKACQNDPKKRYRTAREMSADLAILRSGKSLKRARALERRLANVTRAFVATAAAGLLIAAGYYAWNRHRIGRLEAEVTARNRERQAAQQAARDQTRKLVNAYLANGQRAAQQGDPSAALAWFAGALKEENDPRLAADHENRMRQVLSGLPKLAGFIAHNGGLNSARLSRDASRVITAGADSTVNVWDAATGQLLGKPLRHRSPVRHAEMTPDNQRVLSICQDGTAWLWRVGETTAFELEHGAPVLTGEFSPDGRFALTRGESKEVIIWDGLSARARFKFEHAEVPAHAKYSPDGRCVGVAAGNSVTFWHTERGDRISSARSAKLSHFAFSPDSRRAVVVAGNMAQICNVGDGEWAAFRLEEGFSIIAAEFTPDGRVIITASESGAMRGWDAVTGKTIGVPWHLGAKPSALAVSPDASAMGVVSANGITLVDLRSFQRIMPSPPHRGAVRGAEWSLDARLVLTAGADGAIWLTELFSGAKNAGFAGHDLSREDLMALARLLSGRELDGEQLVEVGGERLFADWRRLGANGAFAATRPAEWHLGRAERLFGDGLWFGVLFHVEQLAKMGLVDGRLEAWKAKATAEMARFGTPERPPAGIPVRTPGVPANLIDLGGFYNAGLAETWLPTNYVGRSNDLSQLPVGAQKFNGVPFDVRGVIQLSGSALENLGGRFPKEVAGIVVDRRATNVHFLHGAAWDARYGTVIGRYVVHYANGEKREAKIVFGRNVRDWWFAPTQPQLTMEAAVAWQGQNPATRHMGMAVRVYQYRWTNPLPEERIATIDFVSAMEKPAPFLLAVTTGGD